ncbi:MAG: membrane fusion protein (multidrug efflux system) [Porticoccus sp.]
MHKTKQLDERLSPIVNICVKCLLTLRGAGCFNLPDTRLKKVFVDPMKTTARLITVIVVLTLILGSLFAWKMQQIKQQQALMSQAPPPSVVEATRVVEDSWPQSLSAIGSVRAVNGIRIANEMAGVVEHIEFESGQQVSAGDLLLKLNTDTDQAALETLKAEQRLALQQFERYSNLIRGKTISQSAFDEAKATLEAAEARVHEQQAILNKKRIRAPFDSIIGLRMVDLGQFLEVGTPIVQLSMLDPIYVDFTIPERELPRINVGDRVEIRVAAHPGQLFSGAVLALETSVSTESRTLTVRAELPNPEHRLRPGMFANVSTYRGQQDRVLTLPRTAISYNTYGDFVFVIESGDDQQKAVQRRSVTTGEVRDGRVSVTSGVKKDEQVVATGLLRLRNGQTVEIVDSVTSDKAAN